MTERDVVFTFSTETWTDAQSRGMARPPDRLLTTLLTSERVGKVLVANPYRSAPLRFARRVSGAHPAPFPVTADQEMVSPLRLRRSDPRTLRPLLRTYERYDRRLHDASRHLGQRTPAVITTHPFVAGFAPLEWAASVTFYARDDWASFPPMRPWWPLVELAYERIRARGVRVCAVSEPVLDRIAPTAGHLVVPNGVTVDEWLAPDEPPAWFSALPRPRLLYTGTLDDRIDVTAVLEVLDAFPTASLTLLGPRADRESLAHLLGVPRVVVHAADSRARLTAITYAADVGLLPHRRTPLTEAMSPLKLYEYLAAGLPVAATDLPPVRTAAEDDRVVLVERGGSFAAAVRAALERGRAAEPLRLDFLARNSWAHRHAAILDLALGVSSG